VRYLDCDASQNGQQKVWSAVLNKCKLDSSGTYNVVIGGMVVTHF